MTERTLPFTPQQAHEACMMLYTLSGNFDDCKKVLNDLFLAFMASEAADNQQTRILACLWFSSLHDFMQDLEKPQA